MVRVTNPSGGSARHSETQREIKTVRVLKPPGGESSISFTDHDFTKRPAKYGVQESPKVENGKVEPAKETPPTPQEEKTETNGSSTLIEKVSSPAEETNGTVKISNGSSDPIPSSSAPPSPTEVVVDSSLDATAAENTITSGPSNGSVHDVNENGSHHDSVKTDSDTNDSVSTLPENPEPVAIDSPNNDSSEHKTKANLPPLHIKTPSTHSSSQNSPTSVTPTVSSPSATLSSPSAKGQDETKGRMFGSPMALASPPVEQPQPRKVVDHMRSSIFGPDDSYIPRASRNNAHAPTPASPQEPIERPTAGQRGRVPPGGFSSKLW